ncbi:hypothetical protein AAMO2058_001683900, partial [Amorphochlora amoebiformis]
GDVLGARGKGGLFDKKTKSLRWKEGEALYDPSKKTLVWKETIAGGQSGRQQAAMKCKGQIDPGVVDADLSASDAARSLAGGELVDRLGKKLKVLYQYKVTIKFED